MRTSVIRPRSDGTIAGLLWAVALTAVGAPGCDLPPETRGDGRFVTEEIPFDQDADPPICQDDELTAVIDVHEHAVGPDGVDALLAMIPLAGVDRTVAFSMLEDCYQDSVTILDAVEESDGALIPFTAVDVRDPNALAFLEVSVAAGARGLKLFSGHGMYHGDTALDSPLVEPIYEYLEQTGTPLLMHVNGPYYLDELERVLEAHPNMVVICPHFCLFTSMPGQLARLLDTYPNLSIDLSFGNIEAAWAGFANIDRNIELWRRFARVYVDRITFGTDRIHRDEATQAVDLMTFEAYLGLVRDETFEYMGKEYQGLAADACTQKHILQHNAERFLAGLPPQRMP